MLSPSFFDHLEDRLNLAIYDINAEHRMGRTADIRAAFGKIPAAAANLHTRYIATRTFVEMGDDRIEVDSTASAEDIARNIRKIKEITEELSVSVIDRLKAKALAAKGIVPDMAKKFEADLDGIIASGADLETQRNAAVAPHLEAIAGMKGELSDLKSAIDILSND